MISMSNRPLPRPSWRDDSPVTRRGRVRLDKRLNPGLVFCLGSRVAIFRSAGGADSRGDDEAMLIHCEEE